MPRKEQQRSSKSYQSATIMTEEDKVVSDYDTTERSNRTEKPKIMRKARKIGLFSSRKTENKTFKNEPKIQKAEK